MSLTESCILIFSGTDASAILGGSPGAGGARLEKQVSWDGPWGLESEFLPVPPVLWLHCNKVGFLAKSSGRLSDYEISS